MFGASTPLQKKKKNPKKNNNKKTNHLVDQCNISLNYFLLVFLFYDVSILFGSFNAE